MCIRDRPWGGKDAPEGQEKKVREENKKGGRFEHGLPGTGDAQLLFMQHAINKLDEKNGRAAIITNGSPLFSEMCIRDSNYYCPDRKVWEEIGYFQPETA